MLKQYAYYKSRKSLLFLIKVFRVAGLVDILIWDKEDKHYFHGSKFLIVDTLPAMTDTTEIPWRNFKFNAPINFI